MGLNVALLSGTTGGGSLFDFLPSILLFVGLIYFMIIRPQKKRQTTQKNLMAAIKVGDKIQTIGGFIGEILVMEEDEFIIQSEETKLRIKRNAVAIRLTPITETEASLEIESTTEENDDDDDFQVKDFEI